MNTAMVTTIVTLTTPFVRQTFQPTTQIGMLPPSTHLQQLFKSPNRALNLHRWNKADATDQVFAKEGAIDGGETSSHIFVGQDLKMLLVAFNALLQLLNKELGAKKSPMT